MLPIRTGVLGGLEKFSSNKEEKPVLMIPGFEMPSKLSEELKTRWDIALKRYEAVVKGK